MGVPVFDTHSSICELLVRADLFDQEYVGKVLKQCAEKDITAGEYLCTYGGISPAIIRAAILSSLLAHDGLLPTATAVAALQVMHKSKVGFDQALENLGFRKAYFEHVKLICNLLEHAECISAEDRQVAYELCITHQLPIIQVLIKRKAISDLVGDVVLVIERLLAQDALSYDQAVQTIRVSNRQQVGADEALQMLGHNSKLSKDLRLGELLMAASILTATDLLGAVERAGYEKRFMGELLVEKGLLNDELLQTALIIQRRINDELIGPADGVAQLSIAKRSQELV